MAIRVMTREDYPAVYKLWKAVPGIGLRSLDDTEQGIARFLARNPGACFVAEAAGEVAGAVLCGYDGRRAYIYHTAVRKEYRRRGIGRALVQAVEAAVAGAGITKIALAAYKTNEAGNRFWEKAGFLPREDLVYRDKSINRENR
ncbi:MAG: GNAT family N-acetyltransferase [Spirochaetaceae bacterium]|nr:GNAT family N-acetyltransferase [Spirochaetaceae bacterium]